MFILFLFYSYFSFANYYKFKYCVPEVLRIEVDTQKCICKVECMLDSLKIYYISIFNEIAK